MANSSGLDRVNSIFTRLGGKAVLLPIPSGQKRPVDKGWTELTFEVMEKADYLSRFNNGGNIGVLQGVPSNGICSIDIDDDNYIELFLHENEPLRKTLRTKRLKGCNFWVWITDEYPGVTPFYHARLKNEKGKPLAIGEWRGTGGQTVIEGQADGIPYQVLVDAEPIRIQFSDIKWPSWIYEPPSLKEFVQNEPRSGNSLDFEKLKNIVRYESGFVRCGCPACIDAGEDKSQDHLCIWPNGKYGCAKWPKDKDHRKLVWKLAGLPKKTDEDDPFNSYSKEKPVPSKLTILRFSQILELKRDENDKILGDNLLNRGSPLVIAGQGGTGKSRLLFQFLAACKMGFNKFLAFDIHPGARELRWLVIQSENSPWRLQDEARKYISWMSEEAWAAFDSSIFTLCPTEEHDTMLNLNDEESVTRIKIALDEFKPDGVIADPLGEFSTGDLNKDVDMKSTILTLSRTIKHGNPKRSLIIAHHALTGQAGAAKAVGYDRASFARNSKVLFNWTRAQINVAPMNEDNNDQLSVSCGKCSDGREFKPFAVRLNTDSMLYECDPTVDVAEWAKELKTGKKGSPAITSEKVRELCELTGSTKSELSKQIIEESGCLRPNAYRYMKTAESEGQIKWSYERKMYFRN